MSAANFQNSKCLRQWKKITIERGGNNLQRHKRKRPQGKLSVFQTCAHGLVELNVGWSNLGGRLAEDDVTQPWHRFSSRTTFAFRAGYLSKTFCPSLGKTAAKIFDYDFAFWHNQHEAAFSRENEWTSQTFCVTHGERQKESRSDRCTAVAHPRGKCENSVPQQLI